MSKYTANIVRKFQFEGDEVKVTMTRMKRKDAMMLMPFIGEPDDSGNVKMTFSSQMELMDAAGDLLPKYIKKITGLVDDDGENIPVETLCDQSYFLQLIGEIVQQLMEASFMTNSERKKSGKSQEKGSQVSAAPVAST